MRENKKMNNNYTEIEIDNNGTEIGRNYRNQLTRTYQYEYALFTALSDLFSFVRCRSLCVNRLKLYFKELPGRNGAGGSAEADPAIAGGSRRRTQEDLLEEMKGLVARDVVGHVNFPMMGACAAEAVTVAEKGGALSFVFTDNIYGFKVRLVMPKKGCPARIEVEDLCPKHAKSTVKTYSEHNDADKEATGYAVPGSAA